MKKLHLILISKFFFQIILLTAQNHQIGISTKTYTDVNRNNRQVKAEIYYPALTAGTNTTPANAAFPFIVFGHGFVMTYTAYENLTAEWVPKGYIVVFANTETGFSPNHGEFGKDLSFLVNELLADNNNQNFILYNKIEPSAAIIGHSMGGGSSILAAENNTVIKTVIGMAPAETNPSAVTAAANVSVPALILSGEKDGVTPPAQHHLPIYNALGSSCKTFINIKGGAHCYFAKSNFNCDLGEATSSPGISITRQQQQQVVYDFVTPWLNYFLKNDANAFAEFTDSLNQSSRITFLQQCSISGLWQADYASSISLYPNPAAEKIHIRASTSTQPLIAVYTAEGKKIPVACAYANGCLTCDVSSLKQGVYYLSAQTAETPPNMVKFIKLP